MHTSAENTGGRLHAALAGLLDGLPPRRASAAVDRLIAHYRGPTPTDVPVLRDRSDVVAYAAYRMPATFEAVAKALAAFAELVPGWRPASHLDVGGGTGAATWAVADIWGDEAPPQAAGRGHEDTRGGQEGGGADDEHGGAGAVRGTTVLDWAEPALALGRELAASGPPALRGAQWRQRKITGGIELPEADLVTMSYLLGELSDGDRHAVVDAAGRAGRVVVIVEPGTPDGYRRIRQARERLTAAGARVVAPCPHSAACPVEVGADWCHFAARVSRSSLHRQVKGGSLPYEDEKFSYVAVMRADQAPAAAALLGRVVRRPQLRKGQVLLDLCCGDGGALRRQTVTKRHGSLYRAARDTDWGDVWPPRSVSQAADTGTAAPAVPTAPVSERRAAEGQ